MQGLRGKLLKVKPNLMSWGLISEWRLARVTRLGADVRLVPLRRQVKGNGLSFGQRAISRF